jgi:hypothetical protein
MSLLKDASRDCARAWEAMPWVLQDSAPAQENQWLMDHLAHCESCSAEFAQQSRLRRAISLPTDLPIDANAGLQRLFERLDAPEEQPASLQLRRRSGSWMTRALVAVVLIQAIGVGAMGMKLWSEGSSPAYRTLSQPAAPVAAGAIHVVPDAGMKLSDWDALLHSMRLQVVNGPNDVGAYTVVPAASSTTAQTLQQLRATPGIRLAEPVSTAP